jgi:hypothetical protein
MKMMSSLVGDVHLNKLRQLTLLVGYNWDDQELQYG